MKLEEVLGPTDLYLESIEQRISDEIIINPYYGFNVSMTEKEPVDQISAFIAAKRIQEYNYSNFRDKGKFVAFIAGIFEVLHQPRDTIEDYLRINDEKDKSKSQLFKKICETYDLNSQLVLTRDLWLEPAYWHHFQKLFSDNSFNYDLLLKDALKFVTQSTIDNAALVKDLNNRVFSLPESVRKDIDNWSTSLIYTPVEISEAAYFSSKGINLKIGPARERTYDKYVQSFMDILHLKQSVDMNSGVFSPKIVSPYREHKSRADRMPEARIFFDDSLEDVKEKVSATPDTHYVYTMDDIAGVVMNPVVEKAVYAVESARSMGLKAPSIDRAMFYSGLDVSEFAKTRRGFDILKDALPELLYQYVIEPFAKIGV